MIASILSIGFLKFFWVLACFSKLYSSLPQAFRSGGFFLTGDFCSNPGSSCIYSARKYPLGSTPSTVPCEFQSRKRLAMSSAGLTESWRRVPCTLTFFVSEGVWPTHFYSAKYLLLKCCSLEIRRSLLSEIFGGYRVLKRLNGGLVP